MEPPVQHGASHRKHLRTAAVVIVLVVVFFVFVWPELIGRFEEPDVVDVAEILRGEVEGDIVMVRGVVRGRGSQQGRIFLEDVNEYDEIMVDGISMLPVVEVQSWAWLDRGDEVMLPVRISRDSDGSLLLVEARRRGETSRRLGTGPPGSADTGSGDDAATDLGSTGDDAATIGLDNTGSDTTEIETD